MNGIPSDVMSCYDLTSHTIKTATKLSVPRSQIAAVSLRVGTGSRALFVGGKQTGAMTRVDIYDMTESSTDCGTRTQLEAAPSTGGFFAMSGVVTQSNRGTVERVNE